jgi:AcrR family transcriptional regulator
MESDTEREIMDATYRALCEHGYADLTVQRIADESSMTSAAIHYHFDTKRDLLHAFLGHLIDRFEAKLACEARDPRERLSTFLDAIFTPGTDRDDDFPTALMELKSQAPYQPAYRDRFRQLDARMRTVVADAVRDGVEAGQFDEVDPEAVARAVVTAVNGGHAREVALGEAPAETRRLIESSLELRLGWAPDGSVETDTATGTDTDTDADSGTDSGSESGGRDGDSEVPA